MTVAPIPRFEGFVYVTEWCTVSAGNQTLVLTFLEAEIIKNGFCDECSLQLGCWAVWLRMAFSINF